MAKLETIKLLAYLQNSSNPDVQAIKDLLALHTLGLIDFSPTFDLLIHENLTNQIDGIIDTFTTSQNIGGKLEVYWNGLLLNPIDDYYQVSPNQIQLIQLPSVGDKLRVSYVI